MLVKKATYILCKWCWNKHNGKPGPGTLVGPYKNQKIGTLQKPEKRDPTKTGTLVGPYKNRKSGTQDLSGT